MQTKGQFQHSNGDPLGLRALRQVEPGYDGWSQVAAGLQRSRHKRERWHAAGGWLAAAASLVLVFGIALRGGDRAGPAATDPALAATKQAEPASISKKDTPAASDLEALITLSQNLESQVKALRDENGAVPAQTAVYTAELEDMVAQVDNELSLAPDSVDLWGQRVNLLLDLAQIYRQQWQIDYDRLAAL